MCDCSAQVIEEVAPWRVENETELEPTNFDLWIEHASLSDLMHIPGMNESIAKLILKFRDTEISFQYFNELIDLLRFSKEEEADLKKAITALQNASDLRTTYIMRYQYSDPIDDDVEKSSYRIGEKIRVQRGADLAVSASIEKDPGEELFWDYNSFSLKAKLPAEKGYFVIGDYTCKVGHGLVIRTKRNFGLGASPDGSLLFDNSKLNDHYSWDENIALRGGALSLDYENLVADLWVSQRARDVRLDDQGNVTSFSYSGLHRTDSEKEGSDICLEDAFGARIGSEIYDDRLNLGITYLAVKWNKAVHHNSALLDALNVFGFDFTLDINKVTISAEAALDGREHIGVMGTVQGRFDNLRQVIALYHIQPDYYSPLSSGLDFNYGEVGNREGVYSHAKVAMDWGSLSGFMHLYRHLRRTANQMWGGKDFYLQGTRLLNQKIIIGASSRWIQEEDIHDNENIRRWRGSTFVSYQFNKGGQIGSRVHLCSVPEMSSLGRLFEFRYSNGWKYSSNLCQGLFLKAGCYHAGDYSQRLFWHETDISHSFRFRALWEKGMILQVQTWIGHSRLGRFEITVVWDQPVQDSGRNASRTLKIVYRYN